MTHYIIETRMTAERQAYACITDDWRDWHSFTDTESMQAMRDKLADARAKYGDLGDFRIVKVTREVIAESQPESESE